MELAKITSKGQITIPIAVRKMLGVKDGDKVIFIENGNQVMMMNASMVALTEAQKAFTGVADEIGVKNDQDVISMIKEIRSQKSGKYICE